MTTLEYIAFALAYLVFVVFLIILFISMIKNPKP